MRGDPGQGTGGKGPRNETKNGEEYVCISRDSLARAITQPCNVTAEDPGIVSFWRDARKVGPGPKFEFSRWHPVREIYNNASAVWHTNSSGFPEICTRVALSDPPPPCRPLSYAYALPRVYMRRVGGRSFQEGPQGLSRFPMLLARTRIYRGY